MISFEQTLLQAGLRPREIVPDGRIRRCPSDAKPNKRNAWYVLHPDGRGFFGDWTSGTGEALGHYKPEGDSQIRVPTSQDLAAIERRRQQERAQRLRAIDGARAHWSRCAPVRSLHPYLERKGLSAVGTQALRVWGDALVVPVLWKGRIISLQSITPDGQKRFWPGAPVKGGAFVLDRQRAALTAVCEGLATGLAIFQSVRNARVIVAFDAGNLSPVVDTMRPSGSVVICADDDHGTEARRGFNPGREKAANAAELIGAGVAWPEGIEGKDWADALAEWGVSAHRRIERQIQAKARYVRSPEVVA